MAEIHSSSDKLHITEQLLDAIHTDNANRIEQLLIGLVSEEIAEIIEAMPHEDRMQFWPYLPPDVQGEVLSHTIVEVTTTLLDELENEQIIKITENLEIDDVTDIVQALPNSKQQQTILSQLNDEDRTAVSLAMAYPEDSAGGLMSDDFIAVREDVTLEVVLRLLRKLNSLPHSTVELFVRDRDGIYVGTLKLNDLLTHDEDTLVSELVDRQAQAVKAFTPNKEVAHIFEKNDLISVAVIDEIDKVLGRITIDDVVDIIREEAEHLQMASAGLNEDEDLFSPPVKTAKRRTFWLGINLLTAIFASFVIGLFDASIEKVVALAILMPIIASMGGIAGTQTATIVIRAIATGKLGSKNRRLLVIKESLVGLSNGVVWALLGFLGVMLVFQDVTLSLIFSAAMLVNLMAAALAGALIPLILDRMKIDPALASGLMLTTVTDSLGFFVFLGLATIVLLN